MQPRSRAPNADIRAFFLILAHYRNRTYINKSRKCTEKLSTHVPLPRPATFGSRRADRDNLTFILIGCGYVLVRIAFALLWPALQGWMRWICGQDAVFVGRSRFRQTGLKVREGINVSFQHSSPNIFQMRRKACRRSLRGVSSTVSMPHSTTEFPINRLLLELASSY